MVTVEYFMDKMQEWEVAELYNTMQFSEYHSWEQTRLLLSCYVDRKKVKSLQDIIRFAWDEKDDNSYDELSETEKKKKREAARKLLKNMSKK